MGDQLVFFVQGAGMANVSPPAMESVVSTLPGNAPAWAARW